MRRYRNNPNSGNHGLLMRLFGYVLTTFIIPFVILVMKLLAYAIVTFVIKMLRKKIGDQQRLSCNKCHGKLQVIEKGNFYCKNCKIIKFDRD